MFSGSMGKAHVFFARILGLMNVWRYCVRPLHVSASVKQCRHRMHRELCMAAADAMLAGKETSQPIDYCIQAYS